MRLSPRARLALAIGLGVAIVGGAVVVSARARRVWPVRPRRGIISGFGVSREGGRRHAGADLGALPGDEIVALADGIVLHSVSGFGIFGSAPPAGYVPLQAVAIRHDDAEYIYAEIRVEVSPGQRVTAGQRIGRAGRNGDGNSMLHLEAWKQAPKGFVPWSAAGPVPAGLLDVGERLKGIV